MPPDPQRFISSSDLPRVLADLAVDEFDLTARREDRHESGNAVHDQARLTFAFAQGILGALPLVDIGQQHAPAGDFAVRTANGKAFVRKPAIHAIRPPKTLHDFVGTAGCDRAAEDVDDVRQILRMNRVVGPPLLEFLECLAEYWNSLRVDDFDLTSRREQCHQAGNAVDNEARIALAVAQRFFRAPAFGDVRHRAHELEGPRVAGGGMTHDMKVLVEPSGISNRCSRSNSVLSRDAQSITSSTSAVSSGCVRFTTWSMVMVESGS